MLVLLHIDDNGKGLGYDVCRDYVAFTNFISVKLPLTPDKNEYEKENGKLYPFTYGTLRLGGFVKLYLDVPDSYYLIDMDFKGMISDEYDFYKNVYLTLKRKNDLRRILT